MNGKIYDNGYQLLGQKEDLIKFFEKELQKRTEEIDVDFCDDILADLKELNNKSIVFVNYDFGMGYMLEHWDEKDQLKEE